MKKLLLSVLLSVFMLCSFGGVGTFQKYQITNSGGTITINPTGLADYIYVYASGSVTLANNYSLNVTTSPAKGTYWKVIFDFTTINLNGHNLSLFGQTVNAEQMTILGYYEFSIANIGSGNFLAYNYAPYDFGAGDVLDGGALMDGTVPLDKLEGPIPITDLDTLGRGRMLIGGASNVLTSTFAAGNGKILIGDGTDVASKAVSGDITLNSAGVTAIAAGAIVNADINASAAIELSKLATLTASKAVVTDGSGIITTANQITPALGGTGISTSASTGFPTVSAGTWSVGAVTDTRDLHVSFATNSLGTYYITFPVAVTVTAIEARVELLLAATDSATIACQNNTGTAMVGNNLNTGLLVLAASATTGTGYTSTLTSNNTFAAGERMRLITNKGTVGGTANVQVTFTRLN